MERSSSWKPRTITSASPASSRMSIRVAVGGGTAVSSVSPSSEMLVNVALSDGLESDRPSMEAASGSRTSGSAAAMKRHKRGAAGVAIDRTRVTYPRVVQAGS